MARLIDGNTLARERRGLLARRVHALRERGQAVRLDAVIVDSGDAANRVYADNQARTCDSLGIEYALHELPRGSGRLAIESCVRGLNEDAGVHAVMVHMPLPEGVRPFDIQSMIDPAKDVEGVNPANIGAVVYGHSSLVPCTALATMAMIESTGVELRGKRAAVVGASNHVGKPIAVLLMRHEATVVSCNLWTPNASELYREADVLVAAAGVPGLITAEMVKPGAIVVDVGVNRVPDQAGGMRTVGDVAFEQVESIAGWISPVPGGVGPMTVAMLLSNVVQAAETRQTPSETPAPAPR